MPLAEGYAQKPYDTITVSGSFTLWVVLFLIANMAHLPEDDLPSKFDVVVDGTGMSTLQTTIEFEFKPHTHTHRLGSEHPSCGACQSRKVYLTH